MGFCQEEGSAGCSPDPRQKGRPLFSEAVTPSHCHPGPDEDTESRPPWAAQPSPSRPCPGEGELAVGRGPGVKGPTFKGSGGAGWEVPVGTRPSITRSVTAAGTRHRSLPQAGWAWTSEEAQCKALTQPGPLTAPS